MKRMICAVLTAFLVLGLWPSALASSPMRWKGTQENGSKKSAWDVSSTDSPQSAHRRIFGGALQSVKKASQSLLPAGSKGNQIMFSGGVYVGEHTSQAASVGSVRQGCTDSARSGLLSLVVGKGFAFFDKLSAPPYFRRCAFRSFFLCVG